MISLSPYRREKRAVLSPNLTTQHTSQWASPFLQNLSLQLSIHIISPRRETTSKVMGQRKNHGATLPWLTTRQKQETISSAVEVYIRWIITERMVN